MDDGDPDRAGEAAMKAPPFGEAESSGETHRLSWADPTACERSVLNRRPAQHRLSRDSIIAGQPLSSAHRAMKTGWSARITGSRGRTWAGSALPRRS